MGGPPVARLAELAGARHAEVPGARSALASLALSERNEAAAREGKAAHASSADWAAELRGRTVCLTLLAGAGTRWVKSLAAARERGAPAAALGFDPARPRGLYPVRDFLGTAGGGTVAIAAYAFAAVRGLGRHLVVVRGWEDEIDREVLSPLGIGAAERAFFTQSAPLGKPLGHGDAAWQCRALLAGADYVVTNFGGDANSRRTVLLSLLAMDALQAAGGGPDLLIPAAAIPAPAYPIVLDPDGLPRSFGHAKLHGAAGAAGAADGAPGPGYTNVGVRVYRAAALVAELERMRASFWVEGEGWSVPGNDPAGRELALDNVDAELAARGRARILAVADARELTPAKSVDEVAAFEDAVRAVVAGDAAFDAGFRGTGGASPDFSHTPEKS